MPITGGILRPTRTVLTSGSGTYNLPLGCKRIDIEMVGGGAGGSGSGTAGQGQGGDGGDTTFGTSLLLAGRGFGGPSGLSTHAGGNGGTATITAPQTGISFPGSKGSPYWPSYNASTQFTSGGNGGESPFGGASISNIAPALNSGNGGCGGASLATASVAGTGGGAGAYIKATINAPVSSYAYSIGTGGTAGTAGTNGAVGTAGAAGVIIITEYY